MALPEPSSKDGQKGKIGDQDDKDFDPSAEAMIDDIDDERTLEEEEALNGASGVAVQEELDDLKKESEMPIEELLAYYERMRNEAQGDGSSEEEDEDDDDDDEEDEEEDDDEEETEHRQNKRKDPDDRDRGNQDSDKRFHGEAGSSNHQNKPSPSSHNKSSSSSSSQQQKPDAQTQGSSNDADQVSSEKTQHINSNDQQRTSTNCKTPTCNIVSSSSANDCLDSTTPAAQTVGSTNTDSGLKINQTNISETTQGFVEATERRRKHSMTDFIVDDDDGSMFKTLLGYDLDSDDLDDDYSYTDDENGDDERDWRRSIHVGVEHQADVPEGLCEYDSLPPYENEDKLVWNCNSNLTSDELLDYLKQASRLSKRNDISVSPASVPKISQQTMRLYRERMFEISMATGSNFNEHNHISSTTEYTSIENLPDIYMSQSRKRAKIDYELEQENALDGSNQACMGLQNQIVSTKEDCSDSLSIEARAELSTEEYFQDEEQLLFLLLQCNLNIDEALRRRKLDPFKYYLYEPMSLWSQEECLGFEHGLRLHGKNFRMIRENRVPTRTHAEVVAFYYLWKKSERHDVYTNQYKLDRKRSLSHPGTTDYMDKFIEDNESILNASSSSTPTPTESIVGADSIQDRAQIQSSHAFPVNRQSYLQPSIQDTPISTLPNENDTCP